MSLFLLVLGAATAVAGLVLAASGVILPEGTFGTEVVTPGTIAAVGGLLLVGIAIAVRQLQRIEQALAARPCHTRAPDRSACRPRLEVAERYGASSVSAKDAAGELRSATAASGRNLNVGAGRSCRI